MQDKERYIQELEHRLKNLEAENLYFKSVISEVHEGIMIVSKDYYIEFANPYATKYLNFTDKNIIGKKTLDVFPKEFAQTQKKNIDSVIKTGKPIKTITDCVQLSNSIIFENYIIPLSKDKKTIEHVICILIDITDFKRKELELIENEEKFRILVENANDGIYIRSKKGPLEFVNDKFVKIHGYPKEELIGLESWKLLHPDDLKDITVQGESPSKIGEGFRGESRIIAKDGTIKHIEINTVPVKTSEGIEKVMGISREITERKEFEKALLDNEEKYRMLIESQGEGITEVDLKEVFTFSNPAADSIFGVNDGLAGKKLQNFMTTEDFERIKKESKLRKKGEISTYELPIISADNIEKTILVTASPKFNKKGKYIGSFGIFRDISETKRIEQALKDSEERFKLLTELTQEGILIHDNGFVIDFNPSLLNLLGYKNEDEIVDRNVFAYIDPEFHDFTLQKMKENYIGSYEVNLIHKSGDIIPTEVNTSRVTINNKILIVVSVRDLRKRKAIEKEIQQLSAAVIQSPMSIVITNLDGKIEYVNPHFTKATGYTMLEAIGQNPRILSSGKTTKEEYRIMWETILAGEVWEGEFHNKRKDGSTYLEYAIIGPIKNDKGEIISFLALKEDVTKRRADQEALKISEKELRASNITKDKFFSILAHDLRGPIGNIMQLAGFLNENYSNLSPEKIEEYVKHLAEVSVNTYDLLDNLLTWSRVQLNKVDFSPKNFNLNKLVQNTIEILNQNLIKKDITCANNIDIKFSPYANEGSVEVIIRNLISNAIKFTPRGGKIVLSAFVKIKDKNKFLEICIEDTGIGIPADKIKQLFELDSDYSTEGTDHEKGTGLGLLLCKEFVEKNGGNIWVTSKEYKGSKFFFTLPT